MMNREDLLKELESWNAAYKLGMDHLAIGNDLIAYLDDTKHIIGNLYEKLAKITLRFAGAPIVTKRVPSPAVVIDDG